MVCFALKKTKIDSQLRCSYVFMSSRQGTKFFSRLAVLFVHINNFNLCVNLGLFPVLKKIIMNPKVHLIVQFKCLKGIPKKTYFSTFTEFIARLEKCVSVKGEYFIFEGLK